MLLKSRRQTGRCLDTLNDGISAWNACGHPNCLIIHGYDTVTSLNSLLGCQSLVLCVTTRYLITLSFLRSWHETSSQTQRLENDIPRSYCVYNDCSCGCRRNIFIKQRVLPRSYSTTWSAKVPLLSTKALCRRGSLANQVVEKFQHHCHSSFHHKAFTRSGLRPGSSETVGDILGNSKGRSVVWKWRQRLWIIFR